MRRALLASVAAFVFGAPPAQPAGEPSWSAVDGALGQAGRTLPGDVHRYGWRRNDLSVRVEGVPLEPALALGSWAGFLPTKRGDEVMVMGDLVLLASEVNPVLRSLQAGGLDVLAVHNHLIGESPQILYVHFGGHGAAEVLARALRGALEATKTPLAAPTADETVPSAPEREALDRVQEVLGRKGSLAGRVLQIAVPRASAIEEGGLELPPSLGLATSLNFQALGSRVAATGDFVLVADEVNPVIRELEARGIQVTALHSHMLHESPRLFFMHFWGLEAPGALAEGLKAGLARLGAR